MYIPSLKRLFVPLVFVALPAVVQAQDSSVLPPSPALMFKVHQSSERIEMTVRTSRILTMDQKIPQAQVNNPDLLDVTPLSPTQIQISAKGVGVTQVNLWGEDKKVFTIDVIILGDARELEMILRSTYPTAALKVTPVANSVLISGYVDAPEHVERIVRIAEEYYPKVINNMTVGGVQQVLLHVKVMEVSRTKLRRLGMDFTKVTGSNVVGSGISGLLTNGVDTSQSLMMGTASSGSNTFAFGVVNGSSAFFGFLDALRQDNLLKVMADPTLVTVSGRPASFNSGGEIPVPVPQSLGTISIEWKQYGTQIDFVPIVLGNGRIRLEVRPYVSELDDSRSITIQGTTVPGIKSRVADTGVELEAGQTLAIAGLVQSRSDSQVRGLPWISEVPYLGTPFRKEYTTVNDVELLMLVTPELVAAMNPEEVPQCGPGMQTTEPSDWELFMKGHLEVPRCCPANGNGAPCEECTKNMDAPPSDGMIVNPGEEIPAPQPSDAAGRPVRRDTNVKQTAAVMSRPQGKQPAPHNRQTSSKRKSTSEANASEGQNSPPGLIGPVGYDVVK